jgi:hypothetical protein
MTDVTHLRRREIEAGVIAPLVAAFAAEVGDGRARQILADVIRTLAVDAGCSAAGAGVGLPGLKRVVEGWTAGGALELTVLRDDPDGFDFDVTRCRYAELYYALGIPELGPLLSCNRDAAFIDGFDPAIRFTRTQTIMQGATHCDFRYRAESAG